MQEWEITIRITADEVADEGHVDICTDDNMPVGVVALAASHLMNFVGLNSTESFDTVLKRLVEGATGAHSVSTTKQGKPN